MSGVGSRPGSSRGAGWARPTQTCPVAHLVTADVAMEKAPVKCLSDSSNSTLERWIVFSLSLKLKLRGVFWGLK